MKIKQINSKKIKGISNIMNSFRKNEILFMHKAGVRCLLVNGAIYLDDGTSVKNKAVLLKYSKLLRILSEKRSMIIGIISPSIDFRYLTQDSRIAQMRLDLSSGSMTAELKAAQIKLTMLDIVDNKAASDAFTTRQELIEKILSEVASQDLLMMKKIDKELTEEYLSDAAKEGITIVSYRKVYGDIIEYDPYELCVGTVKSIEESPLSSHSQENAIGVKLIRVSYGNNDSNMIPFIKCSAERRKYLSRLNRMGLLNEITYEAVKIGDKRFFSKSV